MSESDSDSDFGRDNLDDVPDLQSLTDSSDSECEQPPQQVRDQTAVPAHRKKRKAKTYSEGRPYCSFSGQYQELECNTMLNEEFPFEDGMQLSAYGTAWLVQQEYPTAAGEFAKVTCFIHITPHLFIMFILFTANCVLCVLHTPVPQDCSSNFGSGRQITSSYFWPT